MVTAVSIAAKAPLAFALRYFVLKALNEGESSGLQS